MDERKAQLIGHWIHSHEEDDATHRVFRRFGSSLPPSRGRVELVIEPDLSVQRLGPGADDRPQATPRANISFAGEAPARPDDLKVLSVSEDRLLVARQ